MRGELIHAPTHRHAVYIVFPFIHELDRSEDNGDMYKCRRLYKSSNEELWPRAARTARCRCPCDGKIVCKFPVRRNTVSNAYFLPNSAAYTAAHVFPFETQLIVPSGYF